MAEHWYDNEKGKEFAEAAFKAAGIEEPKGVSLEPGTYSNEQIARKFSNPLQFLGFMKQIGDMGGSEASKRSIASFAIDAM